MGVVERIKELCRERKITVAELERSAGIGNGVIRRWDDRAPASDKLADVATYFSVSTDYLLGKTNVRRHAESVAASSKVPYQDLPPEALEELEQYKEFLRQKYGKK
jgi:transcriptional regulator with XRE-family HTH domain